MGENPLEPFSARATALLCLKPHSKCCTESEVCKARVTVILPPPAGRLAPARPVSNHPDGVLRRWSGGRKKLAGSEDHGREPRGVQPLGLPVPQPGEGSGWLAQSPVRQTRGQSRGVLTAPSEAGERPPAARLTPGIVWAAVRPQVSQRARPAAGGQLSRRDRHSRVPGSQGRGCHKAGGESGVPSRAEAPPILSLLSHGLIPLLPEGRVRVPTGASPQARRKGPRDTRRFRSG